MVYMAICNRSLQEQTNYLVRRAAYLGKLLTGKYVAVPRNEQFAAQVKEYAGIIRGFKISKLGN